MHFFDEIWFENVEFSVSKADHASETFLSDLEEFCTTTTVFFYLGD